MALIESCCGCSLSISSAVLGVYLLVAYIIAFTIELWWILDSSVPPSVGAYLLCTGYFVLFASAGVLLRGLSIKRSAFVLIWLLMMGILLGPEAGLVLYMSIHYWRITSVNGLIEITCWACRVLVNAAAFLCVQSLHTIWRDEKSVLLQLEVLNTQTPIPHKSKPTDGRSKAICVPSMLKSYNNHGYIREDNYIGAKMPEVKTCETVSGTKRGQTQEERLFRSGDYDSAYADSYFTNGFNEFNASSFDPSVIDSRLPYLTIRKKPKNLLDPIGELANDDENMPKTHSLLDLSLDRLKNVEVVKYQNGQLTPSEADESAESSVEKEENVTGSLDRKIIKNKNLKILKKLSPFCRKKPTDLINIYRINPPMGVARQEMLDISNIDSQLNRLYSNRGMYTFEEKTRKIVFYPPEVFNKNRMQGFRSSIQSIVSSQSQSSMDSEDIKQISDVAL